MTMIAMKNKKTLLFVGLAMFVAVAVPWRVAEAMIDDDGASPVLAQDVDNNDEDRRGVEHEDEKETDSTAPDLSSSMDDIVGDLMSKLKKEASIESLDQELMASKRKISQLLAMSESEQEAIKGVSDKIRYSLTGKRSSSSNSENIFDDDGDNHDDSTNGDVKKNEDLTQTSIKVKLNVQTNEELREVLKHLTDARDQSEQLAWDSLLDKRAKLEAAKNNMNSNDDDDSGSVDNSNKDKNGGNGSDETRGEEKENDDASPSSSSSSSSSTTVKITAAENDMIHATLSMALTALEGIDLDHHQKVQKAIDKEQELKQLQQAQAQAKR